MGLVFVCSTGSGMLSVDRTSSLPFYILSHASKPTPIHHQDCAMWTISRLSISPSATSNAGCSASRGPPSCSHNVLHNLVTWYDRRSGWMYMSHDYANILLLRWKRRCLQLRMPLARYQTHWLISQPPDDPRLLTAWALPKQHKWTTSCQVRLQVLR